MATPPSPLTFITTAGTMRYSIDSILGLRLQQDLPQVMLNPQSTLQGMTFESHARISASSTGQWNQVNRIPFVCCLYWARLANSYISFMSAPYSDRSPEMSAHESNITDWSELTVPEAMNFEILQRVVRNYCGVWDVKYRKHYCAVMFSEEFSVSCATE